MEATGRGHGGEGRERIGGGKEPRGSVECLHGPTIQRIRPTTGTNSAHATSLYCEAYFRPFHSVCSPRHAAFAKMYIAITHPSGYSTAYRGAICT